MQSIKELEEYNDYLMEYLEKSGVNFYKFFIKFRVLQADKDEIQIISNRIKFSSKNSLT
jgi:hypothetical protein